MYMHVQGTAGCTAALNRIDGDGNYNAQGGGRSCRPGRRAPSEQRRRPHHHDSSPISFAGGGARGGRELLKVRHAGGVRGAGGAGRA